jgi:DNA-binding MarR family transcriptional regulator
LPTIAAPGDNVNTFDIFATIVTKPAWARERAALDETWELMHFALRAVIARPDEVLAKRGLSRVHHRILFFVARAPGVTVNGLLQTLNVTKQALNQPLRKLITQKLVTSTAAPDDRRQRRLVLTDTGRELEHRLTAPQHALFAEAFAAAGPRAEAAWRRVMRHMAAAEMARSGRGVG